jgi:hypothetical protein
MRCFVSSTLLSEEELEQCFEGGHEELIMGHIQAQAKQIEELKSERKLWDQAMGNLLARIHGDGGHYINKVGMEQAIKDAEEVYCGRYSKLQEARELLKEMEWQRLDGFLTEFPCCSSCFRSKGLGHKHDCKLRAFLKEIT